MTFCPGCFTQPGQAAGRLADLVAGIAVCVVLAAAGYPGKVAQWRCDRRPGRRRSALPVKARI